MNPFIELNKVCYDEHVNEKESEPFTVNVNSIHSFKSGYVKSYGTNIIYGTNVTFREGGISSKTVLVKESYSEIQRLIKQAFS
jgi:hypothetical protein